MKKKYLILLTACIIGIFSGCNFSTRTDNTEITNEDINNNEEEQDSNTIKKKLDKKYNAAYIQSHIINYNAVSGAFTKNISIEYKYNKDNNFITYNINNKQLSFINSESNSILLSSQDSDSTNIVCEEKISSNEIIDISKYLINNVEKYRTVEILSTSYENTVTENNISYDVVNFTYMNNDSITETENIYDKEIYKNNISYYQLDGDNKISATETNNKPVKGNITVNAYINADTGEIEKFIETNFDYKLISKLSIDSFPIPEITDNSIIHNKEQFIIDLQHIFNININSDDLENNIDMVFDNSKTNEKIDKEKEVDDTDKEDSNK